MTNAPEKTHPSIFMDNLSLRREKIGLELKIRLLEEEVAHYKLQTHELIYLLLALEKEVTEGSIAEHLPFNPESISTIKSIRKFFKTNDPRVE